MTTEEIKILIEEQLRKSGWTVEEDGRCTASEK